MKIFLIIVPVSLLKEFPKKYLDESAETMYGIRGRIQKSHEKLVASNAENIFVDLLDIL